MINRLHIYSRRTQTNGRHSVSTGNISIFDEESVVSRLDIKLKEFATRKNTSDKSLPSKHKSIEVMPKRNTVKNQERSVKDNKQENHYEKNVDRQLTSNEKVKSSGT